jgi:pSer/pThr/pTyr-binding forkhead associated (FHA) protein
VPFALGIAIAAARRGLNLTGKTAGISRSHCSIYRSSGRTVVEDHSTHGSYLNGQRVEGKADLVVGDRLRLGSPGIELLLVLVAQDEPGEDNNDRGDDRGTS